MHARAYVCAYVREEELIRTTSPGAAPYTWVRMRSSTKYAMCKICMCMHCVYMTYHQSSIAMSTSAVGVITDLRRVCITLTRGGVLMYAVPWKRPPHACLGEGEGGGCYQG